ncbi:uncharacterized protein LOC121768615 [Salvia splendens]|uniref:uncharacterized protein LOC121768615 n=1 Tax=Salvia splendens TaxID=180675 RepID=UPI001C269E63|nr:uncharacterized protein LOC121768615 [Salvia splendens]XP_042021085.1 uncharacterized protein LOC121768615 [Salvia splendens]
MIKKKTLNKSTTRPSFVLDGFDCPDPFATQPSNGAGGSGTGGTKPPIADITPEVPIIGQPGGEDVEGDVGIPEPFDYEIPDVMHTGAGVKEQQLPPSDLAVGGGLRSTAEAQVNASVGEPVRDAFEGGADAGVGGQTKKCKTSTTGVKIGALGQEGGAVMDNAKDDNTQPKSKGGATKGKNGKEPLAHKNRPQCKGKRPVIDESRAGVNLMEMVMPTVVSHDKGKGKAIQKHAGDVEETGAVARIKKASLAARSPFNERAVRLTTKANIVDRELYYWVLSTVATKKDNVVYKDSFRETLHGEFQSCVPFNRISPAIVDTWTSYLNNMEQIKASETVSRLFFSTSPCMETVVDARRSGMRSNN